MRRYLLFGIVDRDNVSLKRRLNCRAAMLVVVMKMYVLNTNIVRISIFIAGRRREGQQL